MAERKIKQWITINGVHVPIYEGESTQDAVKRAVSKAQEIRNKDDDQKEKDIARNEVAKNRAEIKALVQKQKDIMAIHEKKFAEWDKQNVNHDSEIMRLSKELDKTGVAVTTSKEIASQYATNKNPYKQFTVNKQNDGSYKIESKSKGSISDASAGKASDEARVQSGIKNSYKSRFGFKNVGEVKAEKLMGGTAMVGTVEPTVSAVQEYLDKPFANYGKSAKKEILKQIDRDMSARGYITRVSENGSYIQNTDGSITIGINYSNKDYKWHAKESGSAGLKSPTGMKRSLDYASQSLRSVSVPKSFAANYPNLSSSELKKKYEEYLKKNRK